MITKDLTAEELNALHEMIDGKIESFIKEHLTIEVSEGRSGFNGETLEVELYLKGKKISDSFVYTKDDEGSNMYCKHCGSTDLDEGGCWCNACDCWASGQFPKDLTKDKK